jgi:protein-tyrosine-phosphatase/predicted ATP-grasp superfamily ATP-dependent carboligase
MNGPRKALVIGDDTRSFLATVRSLGRGGIEVHAAPFAIQSPALRSRYISKKHWLPYYLGDGSEWLRAFDDLLEHERFAFVIPCDERALLPLHHHRERFAARTRLAIPDTRTVEVLFDKYRTRELARSLGIPVARGRMIGPNDTAQGLIAEVGLPLAIKPISSYWLDRLYARNQVKMANDESEVADALTEAGGGSHFFEAFFPGAGKGVSVLAHDGRVLQAFQHRRAHEFGGAGFYRVSEELSPPLMDAVNKMIEATGHSGLAMFEFRVNAKAGTWILLEVNARPWGSLPLPVALGIDFPYRWYQLLVDGVETPARRYKIGVYGRNLVPDARQHLARAQELQLKPTQLIGFVLKTIGEYTRVFAGREVYDVFVPDDPTPGWHEFLGKFLEWRLRLFSKLPGFADRQRHLDQLALRDAIRQAKERGHEIAFVCQGNICRSPVAAALLEREIDSDARIRVRSFGNLPRAGAKSPANAITAARSWDVDLETHRSQHFSREAAEGASLVVVFDETNRKWIEERYPTLIAPVVMLGSFLSSARVGPIIADPDGSDVTRFERIYGAIADAVGGMAQQIRDSAHA